MIDDKINTAEVVRRLDNVVHVQRLVLRAHGIGLEDIAGLVVGQSAALHVVGVIGQLDLGLMIDAPGVLCRLFLPQYIQ